MIRHSIQIPWHIARATRATFAPLIITLEVIGAFWTVFEGLI